jgi:hypothetical protein
MYFDLIQFWRKQGVQFLPASEAEVEAAERKHGIRFPPEFREYLVQAGGMKSYDSDNRLFEFYTVDRLESWTDADWGLLYGGKTALREAGCLIFCDFMIRSHAYAIRVSGNEDIGEVVFVGAPKYHRVASSFRTFVDLYLVDNCTSN